MKLKKVIAGENGVDVFDIVPDRRRAKIQAFDAARKTLEACHLLEHFAADEWPISWGNNSTIKNRVRIIKQQLEMLKVDCKQFVVVADPLHTQDRGYALKRLFANYVDMPEEELNRRANELDNEIRSLNKVGS